MPLGVRSPRRPVHPGGGELPPTQRRLPLTAAHSAMGVALAKEVRQPDPVLLCEMEIAAVSVPVTSGVPSHRGSAPRALAKPPRYGKESRLRGYVLAGCFDWVW